MDVNDSTTDRNDLNSCPSGPNSLSKSTSSQLPLVTHGAFHQPLKHMSKEKNLYDVKHLIKNGSNSDSTFKTDQDTPETESREEPDPEDRTNPADTDPIRVHLSDRTRFYRTQYWRETSRPRERSFRPVTPRPRTLHTSRHPDRTPDKPKINRAFRPVIPRKQRRYYSQSPTRSTPLLAASSPDSLLQHQISALQSQALKEPVKEPVDPSLLRGLG